MVYICTYICLHLRNAITSQLFMYIRKYTNIDPTGFVMVFVTSFEYEKQRKGGSFKSWVVTRDRWRWPSSTGVKNWEGIGDAGNQLWKHQKPTTRVPNFPGHPVPYLLRWTVFEYVWFLGVQTLFGIEHPSLPNPRDRCGDQAAQVFLATVVGGQNEANANLQRRSFTDRKSFSGHLGADQF